MKLSEHIRINTKLAIPVVITQLGQISVNFIDIIFISGLENKEKAIASASLATSIFFIFLIFAFGFSYSMSPLISSAVAKKNDNRVREIIIHGLVLNVSFALVVTVLIEYLSPLLVYTGQDPEVIADAITFLKICIYSLIPLMVFQSFRQFAEGISITYIATIATISANVINIILNYGLIYGKFGLPEMHLAGSATATLIARIFLMIFILLVLFFHKKSYYYLKGLKFKGFKSFYFGKLIYISLPSSLQSLFEISAFALTSFIAGMHSYLDTSAHSVAINYSSLSFNICLGFSVAAVIRVAGYYALRNTVELRKSAMASLYVVILIMSIACILYILLRNYMPLVFFWGKDVNPEVLNISSKLLVVAGLFQIFDGVQLVCLGALRSMRDVVKPTIYTFIAYIIITIPMGYLLCIYFDMGVVGAWIGLFIGLLFNSAALYIRFNNLTKGGKIVYGR